MEILNLKNRYPAYSNTELPAIFDDEFYETELNNYLNDKINYGANTIKNADIEDLQQLAADSFFYGYLFAVKRLCAKK